MPRNERKDTPSRAGTVVLCGLPNVGKSTLLNALVGEPIAIVSHHPQTTRSRLLGVATTPDAQIAFLDTPGHHTPRNRLGAHMNREIAEALATADVTLFVTDVGRDGQTRLGNEKGLFEVLPEKKVVCVINKVDRIAKPLLLPVLVQYDGARAFEAVVPVSAKKKDNLARLVRVIVDLLPEGPPLYEKDTLTDRPIAFLCGEIVREQVLARVRDEVPYGVTVTVDAFLEGKVTKIAMTIHVAKDSHRKIVIGKGGSLLKAAGQAARLRIEELAGGRIHLDLFVRVTPAWFESDAKLRELGYQ